MFIPSAFVETDLVWLDRLLARDAFVTLVTTGTDGLPQATRLPVLYKRDADGILIEGHWARPNPQAGHAGPALMLVQGPHAYISPGWYPDKAAQARVPTWNYAAAELRGVLEPTTDPDTLIAMLDGLSAHYEAQVGGDWDLLPIEPRQQRMLGGIVGYARAPRLWTMRPWSASSLSACGGCTSCSEKPRTRASSSSRPS
jgi:transcriptional regulator